MGVDVEIVPMASTVHKDWNVTCSHTAAQLAVRIPLEFIHALDTREETPIFQPKNFRETRPCFRGTHCFRAVRDDFVTDEEASAIWHGLEPHYERPVNQRRGERYIGIHAGLLREGLLNNVTRRMKRFLEAEMGACVQRCFANPCTHRALPS